MRIIKIIESGLRIDDYLTAASSLTESLLVILRQRYENRCYCSCLIKKVTRIIKHGPLIIDPLSAKRANISVRFEVEAIVFARGEVLVGCKVERRDTTKLITCTHNNAIILAEDSILDPIKEGQLILLEVVETQYPIMTKNIAASAVPFLPPVDKPAYIVDDPINEKQREMLADLVLSVQQAEEKATALRAANPRGYEFFEQQLYPFRQQSAPENSAIVPIMDLVENKLTGRVVSRDPHLGYASGKLAVWEMASVPASIKTYSQYSAYDIAVMLMTEYVDGLRVVHEMIETYSTPELIKSHVGLWLIFKTAKK